MEDRLTFRLSGRLLRRRRLARHVNEVHIVFPTGGLIWDDGDTATTDVMRITHGEITLEHPGQSAFYVLTEWTNQ